MKILISLKFPTKDVPHVKTGLNMAKKLGARITFLHVVDTTPPSRAMLHKVPERMIEELRTVGKRSIESVMKLAKEKGIESDSVMKEGYPADEILEAMEGFDLVMMRPRCYSDEKKLGDVTEEVVKKSHLPVVLIRQEMEKFDNCLLPYDGSPQAQEVLDFMCKANELLNLKNVFLLYVASTPEKEEEGKGILEEAESKLKETFSSVSSKLIKCEKKSEIAVKICEFCNENDINIIAMGRTGKGRIQRFIIGSVSREVIICTDVPVIIVPENAEKCDMK